MRQGSSRRVEIDAQSFVLFWQRYVDAVFKVLFCQATKSGCQFGNDLTLIDFGLPHCERVFAECCRRVGHALHFVSALVTVDGFFVVAACHALQRGGELFDRVDDLLHDKSARPPQCRRD